MNVVDIQYANGDTEQLVGVVAIQGGAGAVQFQRYTGQATIVPYANTLAIDVTHLTDEEIMNGDAGLAAWYAERKAAAEAAQAEATSSDESA